MIEINIAKEESDIRKCYRTISQLRPHLSEEVFLQKVISQRANGYTLVNLAHNQDIKAVAGFRISQCLAWGSFMYVDDLITDQEDRSKGYGSKLFDWLVNYAEIHGCEEFHLDSGVQRFQAHRFYLSKKLDIVSHHFSMKLSRKDL